MSTGLGVRGLYYGLSEAPRCVLSPSHLTSLGSLYLLENKREAKARVGRVTASLQLACSMNAASSKQTRGRCTERHCLKTQKQKQSPPKPNKKHLLGLFQQVSLGSVIL